MTDVTQILEKARELGRLVADSEELHQYAAAKAAYENDPQLSDLMTMFNTHKASIAALSKQDEPDAELIAKHEDKLKEIYGEIMASEITKDYQLKSKVVEQILEQINNVLSFYVNGEDPQGCSGSCATCGGCN